MFRAILRVQYRESRLAILVLAGIAFAIPLVAFRGLDLRSDPWDAFQLLSASGKWSAAYPLLALGLGLVLAGGAWAADHRSRHVYALTLPVARWRYLLLRYIAGGILLLGVGALVYAGGAMALSRLTLPPLLHGYPGGLAIRFCLAGLSAYTLLFALNGITQRAARFLVAGLLLLVVLAALADLLSLDWHPLGRFMDAVLGPYSPLAIFRARWMLIDV